MKLCVRIIDPAFDVSAPMWGDASGSWVPPAVDWLGTLTAAGVPVVAGPDASSDDGEGLLLVPNPEAVDVRVAPGRPVLTGPPPPGARDRLVAVRQALGALVLPDLAGVVVLRLDDPGAAVKQHLDSWRHDAVTPEAWAALWRALEPDGGVSVFSCTGYVRADGSVVDSRSELPEEWRQLDEGVRRGAAVLECHGHTHMHPDLLQWRDAEDRFTSADWYRELWPPRSDDEPTVHQQMGILRRWQESVGPGTSVVAPGEAWGVRTILAARFCGFDIFNSWELCRLQLPVPTWTRGVGSPYLDQPDPVHLESGLPTVGYWHDRDMALHGPRWSVECLQRWREVGARRFWSFDRLAAAYRIDVDAVLRGREVTVLRAPQVPLRVELAV